MHYITNAFYGATGWSEDNTYKELNATARGTLPPGPTLSGYLGTPPSEPNKLQNSSTSPSLEDSV